MIFSPPVRKAGWGRLTSLLSQVLSEIHKAVARVNKLLAPFEQVRRYRVLARDFSI
jgi:hypothetical protein